MLNNKLNDTNIVDQLDREFDVKEVDKAISCLKYGKSDGIIDMLIPEMFKEYNTILSHTLCKLLNYMFVNSIYSNSWSKGILVSVPKKGNLIERYK